MALSPFLTLDVGLFRLACLIKKLKCMLDHEDQRVWQLKCANHSLSQFISIWLSWFSRSKFLQGASIRGRKRAAERYRTIARIWPVLTLRPRLEYIRIIGQSIQSWNLGLTAIDPKKALVETHLAKASVFPIAARSGIFISDREKWHLLRCITSTTMSARICNSRSSSRSYL